MSQSGHDEVQGSLSQLSSEISDTLLNTPELICLILAHLDLATLLHAQRVSRSFRALILNSSGCQRALFFVGEKTRRPYENGMTCKNELLEKKFGPWFKDAEITEGSLSRLELAHKRDAYMRPEASWRKMLVAQPPIATLRTYSLVENWAGQGGVLYRGQVPRDQGSIPEKIAPLDDKSEEGRSDDKTTAVGEVRMGMLYDLTEEFLGKEYADMDRCLTSGVHITWHMRHIPRFRRYVPGEDQNVLHYYARNNAPGQLRHWKPKEEDTGDDMVNEEWKNKYRSKAFGKVLVAWDSQSFPRESCAQRRGSAE